MIKVNGQEIPKDAIEYELNRLIKFYVEHGMTEDQIRKELPVLRAKAEQQAIGAKLLFDEAARLDVPVPEEDIDTRIEEMKAEVNGEKQFMEILKKRGTNVVELRNQIKVGRRVDKLIEKITSNVPEPSDADVETHFNEHASEYGKGEQVLAQHILITPKSDSSDDKFEALGKIQQIRKRIEEGADFAQEAAAHSGCPSGKRSGGSLGWFSRGMMVKEFDEIAFSLPVNGLSDIVETQFGYHLIFKNDEEAASEPNLSEVFGQVRDFLRHVRRGEALSAYVDELREKARIEII